MLKLVCLPLDRELILISEKWTFYLNWRKQWKEVTFKVAKHRNSLISNVDIPLRRPGT